MKRRRPRQAGKRSIWTSPREGEEFVAPEIHDPGASR